MVWEQFYYIGDIFRNLKCPKCVMLPSLLNFNTCTVAVRWDRILWYDIRFRLAFLCFSGIALLIIAIADTRKRASVLSYGIKSYPYPTARIFSQTISVPN